MLPLSNTKQKAMRITEDDLLDEKQTSASVLSLEEMKSVISDIKKMSNSSNMKSVVSSINVERKRSKFYEKVEVILKKFDDIKLDNNDERIQILFMFVMQSATDYLFDDCKEKRDEICITLLKRFVNDDEFITKNIMNIVSSKVKPLTFYRKYKHSLLKGLGFFFFTMLLRAN